MLLSISSQKLNLALSSQTDWAWTGEVNWSKFANTAEWVQQNYCIYSIYLDRMIIFLIVSEKLGISVMRHWIERSFDWLNCGMF